MKFESYDLFIKGKKKTNELMSILALYRDRTISLYKIILWTSLAHRLYDFNLKF